QGLGASRTVNLDSNDDVFQPMAGLVFKVNEDLSLYGYYSRSFVPNDEVNDDGTTFDPVEGRSYEVGAKFALAPELNVNLAVFDIEKKNVVTPNGVTGVSEAAG
ncbi:TonB-dependent receptor, partial [Pseudomonas syringae pv. tagetis]|uniref:TonB-dependent receptor domain-containing protein n=1 Tax=Pseudomonas syringae group genomosp. 7 TaxID=251699 RepID=UPI00376F8270